ncbi:MAG: carboxypeptidase-like regulatory domain-containing protein [Bacteroidia bacterium]|nr:carboxypeptidase-like regulatory domain-containing protein [Bacteroidia bacterium]
MIMKLAVRSIRLILLFILVFAVQGLVFGQSHKRVIQLSGVILGEDSVSGVPGVHIYVPKAGRGTSSLRNGYFSMAVLVGDSVVISAIGYARQHWIIPESAPEFYTVIVEMVTDVTYLKEVTIMPFPTEEVFKQAVLALNLPMDNGIDQRNMNAELLALMMQTAPMDGNANYRYYMDQYPNSIRDQYQPRTNPFLNPFNWARFFRDLKQNK